MITIQVECYTEQGLLNPHIDTDKSGIFKAPRIYNLSSVRYRSVAEESGFVKQLAMEGLARRYHNISPLLHDRLKYELNLFDRIEGIYPFLLFIIDISDFAREKGITTPPGWSGSPGSLVLYCLGITDIDPIEFGLMPETFLRPGANAKPCIFLPVPENNQEQIFEYITDRTGEPDETAKPHSASYFGLHLPGFRNLTFIKEALAKLQREGRSIDLNNIFLNYKKTFELLSAGKTDHMFEFDSAEIKEALRKLKPDTFSELTAFVALRPQYFPDNFAAYIAAKKNNNKIIYKHPKLEKHLKETYGLLLYREQIINIICDFSGLSTEKAFLLWRNMSGKKSQHLVDLKKEFTEGCAKNGYDRITTTKIFDFLQTNTPSTFMKSHAVAAALLAYQTIYLETILRKDRE